MRRLLRLCRPQTCWGKQLLSSLLPASELDETPMKRQKVCAQGMSLEFEMRVTYDSVLRAGAGVVPAPPPPPEVEGNEFLNKECQRNQSAGTFCIDSDISRPDVSRPEALIDHSIQDSAAPCATPQPEMGSIAPLHRPDIPRSAFKPLYSRILRSGSPQPGALLRSSASRAASRFGPTIAPLAAIHTDAVPTPIDAAPLRQAPVPVRRPLALRPPPPRAPPLPQRREQPA